MSIEPTAEAQNQSTCDPVFKYPSLLEYGAAILQTNSSRDKSQLTFEAFEFFNNHNLPLGDIKNPPQVEDHPARPENLTVLTANLVSTKVKGESLESHRLRMIHAQAHIESWAIDLSWDIMVRFAAFTCVDGSSLPRDYFADWLKVAYDEAKHFCMWEDRLVEGGSHYGAYPTHNALWDSAFGTKHDILARLAIVHMVHEAHGVDCADRLLNQFLGLRDKASADLFRGIVVDEITHVAAGFRWFTHITGKITSQEKSNLEQGIPSSYGAHCGCPEGFNQITHFHYLVGEFFFGAPRPPFNHQARLLAGMTPEWYEPLAKISHAGKKLNIKELMAQRKLKTQGQMTDVVDEAPTQDAIPDTPV